MKCEIEVVKILFPKRIINSGDFAIFSVRVLKIIEGEAPEINETFKTVSLKGRVPTISEGDKAIVELGAKEVSDYGISYKLISLYKKAPVLSGEGLIDFLKLITSERIAGELCKLENAFDLLMNKKDSELLKVKGVGQSTLNSIYKRFDIHKDKAYALSKLVPLGVTANKVTTICKALGDGNLAVEVCMNNPYSLLNKVKGFGFKTVDEIALKCGFNNRIERIEYAIKHILYIQGENGKSWLTAEQLIAEISNLFVADMLEIKTAVQKMAKENNLHLNHNGDKVCLPRYYSLELDIAKRVKELLKCKSYINIPANYTDIIKKIEDNQGWEFTSEQKNGIRMALCNNITLVTGYAGTGKSTITNAVCEILDSYDIVMACLSAKASQRLREVTKRNAQTIHSLLKLNTDEEVEEIDADVIIIDEATMVNADIFKKVFFAVKKGAKLIILGDVGQLTSIGNGAVFNDLIVSGKVPHINLTEIHRQAKKSSIVVDSINIRNQKPIYPKGFKGRALKGDLKDLELFVESKELLFEETINKFFIELEKYKDIKEVQIIAPLKNRGELSVSSLNNKIQERIMGVGNKGTSFFGKDKCKIYKGDKVINTKNKKGIRTVLGNTTMLANGNIGIVKDILDKKAIIDFSGIGQVIIEKNDLYDINLAYAISVHSSQGSQWECVLIGCDTTAYALLNVEMLYTAITRAKTKADLIIEPKAMYKCLSTVEQKTKQTFLGEFLNIL